MNDVAFDAVLRHWSLADFLLARLLLELAEGVVVPTARIRGRGGLPSLTLPFELVERIRQSGDGRHLVGNSVPEIARCLNVKQEVAYFLLRRGLLEGTRIRGPKREEWRVTSDQVQAFSSRYAFARDLAAGAGMSPRAVIARLAAVGRYPCSGPGIDGGRQVLFCRSELQSSELPLW
jgi:hypothetical protein